LTCNPDADSEVQPSRVSQGVDAHDHARKQPAPGMYQHLRLRL
jgi:hypothetical protein